MSNAPLFYASRDTLRAALRLTGLATSSDADAILDQALLTVRLGFIRHLTQSRIDQILAMPSTSAPTTAAETTRAVANVTEVEWVRHELMRTLPVLFQDASGDAQDVWNREAPFRKAGPSDLERQRDALKATILENLEMLLGNETQGEEGTVQGGAMSAATAPPAPFDSIFPVGGLSGITRQACQGGVL